jgi:lipid-A-disaccharide synthase
MCGCGNLPRFYHVVAPQVWAWGAKRAKKFPKVFDKLYSFFEFEKPYFTKYGLDTVAVGHPIADGLNISNYRAADGGKKIITLLPGSRMSEVKKLLPVFHSVVNRMTKTHLNRWDGIRFSNQAAQHPSNKPKYDDKGFEFVIPTTETTEKFIRNETKNWTIKPRLIPFKDRYQTLEKTYIAIAASGTISAELAIMHIPAIVVYKMNALTMCLACRMVKIKWVSLVNILLQKTVYPELLGGDATAENIVREVERLSKSRPREKMISELKSADKMWRRTEDKTASQLIAEDILKTV